MSYQYAAESSDADQSINLAVSSRSTSREKGDLISVEEYTAPEVHISLHHDNSEFPKDIPNDEGSHDKTQSVLISDATIIRTLEEDNKRLIAENKNLRKDVGRLKEEMSRSKFNNSLNISLQNMSSVGTSSRVEAFSAKNGKTSVVECENCFALRHQINQMRAQHREKIQELDSQLASKEAEMKNLKERHALKNVTTMSPRHLTNHVTLKEIPKVDVVDNRFTEGVDSVVEKLKLRHQEELRDLTRKVEWYLSQHDIQTANMALLDEQHEEIVKLKREIISLKEQLTGTGFGRRSVPSRSTSRSQIASRVHTADEKKTEVVVSFLKNRIVELEDGIEELNRVARQSALSATSVDPSAVNAGPLTLQDIVRVCRPSFRDTERYKEMERTVESFQKERQEETEDYVAKIFELRRSSDALKLNYEKKLERIENEMSERLKIVSTKRVKMLEAQLKETRHYYMEKLKKAKIEGSNNKDAISVSKVSTSGSAALAHKNDAQSSKLKPSTNTMKDESAHIIKPQNMEKKSKADIGLNKTVEEERKYDSSPRQRDSESITENLSQQVLLMQMQFLRQEQRYQQEQHEQRQHKDTSLTEGSQKTENKPVQENKLGGDAHFGMKVQYEQKIGQLQRQIRQQQDYILQLQSQQLASSEGDKTLGTPHTVGERFSVAEFITALVNDAVGKIGLPSDNTPTPESPKLETTGLKNTGFGDEANVQNRPSVTKRRLELKRFLLEIGKRLEIVEEQYHSHRRQLASEVTELRRIAEVEQAMLKEKFGLILKRKNEQISEFQMQLNTLLKKVAAAGLAVSYS